MSENKRKLTREELRARRDQRIVENERRQKIINYSAMGAGVLVLLALFVLAATGNFQTALNAIGLQSTETAGVYIDCTQKKNKSNKYCQTERISEVDSAWKSLRNANNRNRGKGKRYQKPRGGAFSLTQ